MKISYPALLRSSALLAGLFLAQSGMLTAQQTASESGQDLPTPVQAQPVELASLLPESPMPAASSASPAAAGFAYTPVVKAPVPQTNPDQHRFWDRENKILFAVAGGLATADFFVTRSNLASGGKELNPITRVLSGSTPGLAANFGLEVGGLIGVNYLFHKTGHHKLERISSFVNIGGSASAVAFGLSHR